MYIGIGLIVTSIAAVCGFFIIRHFINKKNMINDPFNTGDLAINNGGGNYTPNPQPNSGGCVNPTSYINSFFTFPIKKGKSGANVLLLQKALNKKGAALKEDGQFGCGTENKLKEISAKLFPGHNPVTQINSKEELTALQQAVSS